MNNLTTRVLIDNVGEFHIQHDKLQELISWLSHNQAIKGQSKSEELKEIINTQFPGRELIQG